MKKLLSVILLVTCLPSLAGTFVCEATYNTDSILKTEVKLGANERNKAIADLEEFVFYLSDNKNNVVELQTLNRYEPTRTYATAKVMNPGDFVQLSIWKREYLLEVTCTLQ